MRLVQHPEGRNVEERRGEPNHPGQATQQQDAGDERETQAGLPGFGLLGLGQLARQNGNEHDVINAQNDLEHRQGEQTDPDFRVGDPIHNKP